MAGAKEIKTRIKSVSETEKITNAMYLISSTKVRKAKSELEKTKPYFEAITAEIKRVFKTVERFESKYFYPEDGFADNAPYGYLAITADKGLAGAYNHNIIKQVEKAVTEHDNSKIYVIGDYGREYFRAHGRAFEEDFTFSAQRQYHKGLRQGRVFQVVRGLYRRRGYGNYGQDRQNFALSQQRVRPGRG